MTSAPPAKRSRQEIAEAVYADQVISIEVGERTFKALRRTWTLVEASVLGVAVSLVPAAKEPATLDHFFDEPPEAFALVLGHLRSNCRNVEAPACDRALEGYWATAKKLGFARLAAHLELERLRRSLEREAAYLDAQISRCRHCLAAWRRRCRSVDVKPLVVDAEDFSERAVGAVLNDDRDDLNFPRKFAVKAAVAAATDPAGDALEGQGGSKVCLVLESERQMHDHIEDLPSNFKFAARLQEDLIYRRLGLQRLLSRLPAALRARSAAVSSAASTRALFRDLYAFQGHELNESDRVEEVEFEAPLYGKSGNPEGGAFERLPGGPDDDAEATHPGDHTWAYEYDGDQDAPWFDAGADERARHDAVDRLLADLGAE